MSTVAPPLDLAVSEKRSFYENINTRWHETALFWFMVVVLAHWVEHIAQAWQIWVLGWPRHHAGGALGYYFPWLVHSEVLHYVYALLMLIGLIVLRKAFTGTARTWWDISLAIQIWHHFEHALLLGQAMTHKYLFGATEPTSIIQTIVPRIELHLFYNTVVFIPMAIGMYYHVFPPKRDIQRSACTCARHRLATIG